MGAGAASEVDGGAGVRSGADAGVDVSPAGTSRSDIGSLSEMTAGRGGEAEEGVELLGSAASAASAARLAAAFFRQCRRRTAALGGGGHEPSDSTLDTMRSTMANASAGRSVE